MTDITPAPGTNDEFDKIMASIEHELVLDPGGASLPRELVRNTTAGALSRYTSMTFPSTSTNYPASPPDNTPDEPLVSVSQERQIVVPTVATEPYWYEPEEDAAFFEHLIHVRRKLGARVPGGFLITGPAGSGKTRGVVEAAKRYNTAHETSIPILVMNCPTITDPQKWFGRREVDTEGTHYVESDFVRAYREGWIVVLDEFMRLHPTLTNPIMSGMDGTEAIVLSDMNLRIERHPETVIFGTTNQGAQFGGTHRMDWAMRERWSYTIERDFPPVEEEVRVLTSHNPGCSAAAARLLVEVADASRKQWQSGDLRSPISTRTLDNAAFLVASGYSTREALERTALPEYDDTASGATGAATERSRVRSIIVGKVG